MEILKIIRTYVHSYSYIYIINTLVVGIALPPTHNLFVTGFVDTLQLCTNINIYKCLIYLSFQEYLCVIHEQTIKQGAVGPYKAQNTTKCC